jgi:hypothetical protein
VSELLGQAGASKSKGDCSYHLLKKAIEADGRKVFDYSLRANFESKLPVANNLHRKIPALFTKDGLIDAAGNELGGKGWIILGLSAAQSLDSLHANIHLKL